MLAPLLVSLTLVAQTPAPAPAPAPTFEQAATPGDCLKAARAFTSRRQTELRPLTVEKLKQIDGERIPQEQACAAKFNAATLAPADLVALAEVYGDLGDAARSSELMGAVRKHPKVTTSDIANVLVLQINNGLREPKSDERNARLEKIIDELDTLGPEAFEQQFSAHSRMNGYYRGDDIDAGIIKHSTWIINAGATCKPEDRQRLAPTVASAHVNMAEAWAGQGMTAKALSLLDDGVKAWGGIAPRPNAPTLKEMYFDDEIARLKLVGTTGAPISAPTWFNGPAGGSMNLAGKVTLLEFTAHWCGPCRESYPGVNRLRAKYGPQGFQVVLATRLWGYFESERNLAADAELAKDKTYFAHHELSDVPVAIGPLVTAKVVEGKVVYEPHKDVNDEAYRVGGIPQIMLVDKKGTIRLIMVGYDDANEPKLAKMIEDLLKEK